MNVSFIQGFSATPTYIPSDAAPSYKRLIREHQKPNFPIDFMRTPNMGNFLGLSLTGIDRSAYNRAIDEVSNYFNGRLRDGPIERVAPALASIVRAYGPSYNPLSTIQARNWIWVVNAISMIDPDRDDARLVRSALSEVTRFFNDLKSTGTPA